MPRFYKHHTALKRFLDITLALFGIAIFAAPMVLIVLAIKLTSKGPVLHISERIGRDNAVFKMPKFRTMTIGTPPLATHLLTDPAKYLTPIGNFLRKLSLDELPQLFSILKGDMSFVGPRPALFNQYDLIAMRTSSGIHTLLPGLTGYAQINGRDKIAISEKVKMDEHYLKNRSLFLDIEILCITVLKVLLSEGIKLEGESNR